MVAAMAAAMAAVLTVISSRIKKLAAAESVFF
jgi:hypothetical protein